MTDISTPLTDDEATVLDIAAQQGTIGAIGRWEAPVKSLLKRGLMKDLSGDTFNCAITDAGRAVMRGQEVEEDKALGRAVDRMREMAIAQKSIQEMVSQCADVLVQIARLSNSVTGDDPSYAAGKWSEQILLRALDKLR